MEKLFYFNQPNCYRLSNETVELIVTTDIGPRIVRYAFAGEANMLGEVPDLIIKTELGDWKPWGGHRLWVAPEANPRSYSPDNSPVEYEIVDDNTIRLMPPVERKTGIQKEMTVTLDQEGTSVTIRHKIVNRNLWGIDAAPWALTIMNGGGAVIFPQEPYRSWGEYLLPARPLVLWHYTDLSDPRWTIGKKYIRLSTDEHLEEPQKIGLANKQEWAAYHRGTILFVKRFTYEEGSLYPDYGSNTEAYTAGPFIELESLAPIHHLEPDESAEHIERWYLFRNVEFDETEEGIESAISPLISQTATASRLSSRVDRAAPGPNVT